MTWRPNWKDPEQYPQVKPTKPKQWAWEFLRRNQEYQLDFQHMPSVKDNGEYRQLCDKWAVMDLIDPASNFDRALAKRLYFTDLILPGTIFPEDLIGGKNWTLKPNDVLLHFDLSLPLQAQLKGAEKQLNFLGCTKSATRLRKALYPRYLRLLDAKAAGANLYCIESYDLLLDENRNGDDQHSMKYSENVAEEMQLVGWRTIAVYQCIGFPGDEK